MTGPEDPSADTPLDGLSPGDLLAAGLGATEPGGPPDAPSPQEIGRHFPALDVIGLIGQGGMGLVYRARQKALDRVVALKILSPRLSADPAFAERFQREARALARLDHPNIVRVHETGEVDGLCYLILEHVEGVNLREAMRAGRLEPKQSLAIVPQVCDALQYAHDRGVVHRDIKPENVLLDLAGNVKITDFGLAKLTSGAAPEHTLTQADQVMGTLHYMAPEQLEHPTEVDHRADIYSLGVVFYEMLTGELPLGRFDPPSERVQVDVRLDDVVLRALSKQRERRYQSASAVRTEVDSIAVTPPRPTPQPRPARENVAATHPDAKTSRKALAGVLCMIAAPVLLVGSALLGRAFGGMSAQSGIVMGGAGLAGIVGIAGLVLSVWGWVDIHHSRGRLRGTWMAALGTIGPFLCVAPGVVALGTLFLSVGRTPSVATAVQSSASIWDGKVVNPPPEMTADEVESVRRSVLDRLDELHLAVASGRTALEELAHFYPDADADRLRGLADDERARATHAGRAGLPLWFTSPAVDRTSLVKARSIRMDGPDALRAWLTPQDSPVGWVFDMVREDGNWFFRATGVSSMEMVPWDDPTFPGGPEEPPPPGTPR